MTEVYNFAAGPAVLPVSVIKQMQAELPSFKDSGMSVLEISHRSSLYEEMFHQAKSDLRKLMKIPFYSNKEERPCNLRLRLWT